MNNYGSAVIKEVPGMPGFYTLECIEQEAALMATHHSLEKTMTAAKNFFEARAIAKVSE